MKTLKQFVSEGMYTRNPMHRWHEHQAEWEREQQVNRMREAENMGRHEVHINGKHWKEFLNPDHAHKAAATVHRNTGKEVKVISKTLEGKPHPTVQSVIWKAKEK
jgi:hypothetical protein